MSAKSILKSGNTTFLPGLQNGTGTLTLESLSINSVLLEAGGSGIIEVTGALQPTDIVDNSGSIGTPGQVLTKATGGTDMLWSSDISLTDIECATLTATDGIDANDSVIETTGQLTAGDITAANGITSTAGNITATAGGFVAPVGSIAAGASISAGTTITAGTDITATAGNIVATAGDIIATAGSVTSGSFISSGSNLIANNNITANNGNISASNGSITAATAITLVNGNFTIDAGNIVVTAGDITASGAIVGASFRGSLIDSAGETGQNGQIPVANGAGGWVWTDPA